MSALDNSPLEKGDEGGCFLAARIWSTRVMMGAFCLSEAANTGTVPTYMGLYSKKPPALTAACKLIHHLQSGELRSAKR